MKPVRTFMMTVLAAGGLMAVLPSSAHADSFSLTFRNGHPVIATYSTPATYIQPVTYLAPVRMRVIQPVSYRVQDRDWYGRDRDHHNWDRDHWDRGHHYGHERHYDDDHRDEGHDRDWR